MLDRLFGRVPSITGPLEVTHVLHLDKSLNWTFDDSVDPKTIFTKLKVIGKGGFGTVSKIVHRPSMKILAGKLINPSLVDDTTQQEIEEEIQLMREVDSPWTVKYYGSVQFEGSLMILMEFCDRGSIRDLLDTREQVLSEDQISVIIRDVLKGLQFIQTNHRIVHRDIKSANILLTASGQVRIADFGVSRRFDSGGVCQTTTIVGTPYWMAPEVIVGHSYSFPADIWSLGITAVEMSEGSPPWAEYPPTKAMVEISTRGFPGYRFPGYHSAEFVDFVANCVRKEPNERATIIELLEHPFIKRAERISREEVLEDLLRPIAMRAGDGSLTIRRSISIRGGLPPEHQERLSTFVGTFEAMAVFVKSINQQYSGFNSVVSGNQLSARGLENVETAVEQAKNSIILTAGKKGVPPSSYLTDEEFVQVARAASTKIPFIPCRPTLDGNVKPSTLYRPYADPILHPKDGPLFDDEGVLNVQHALRNRKTPQRLGIALIVFVLFFFGIEGLVVLATLALITHLIVVRLRVVRTVTKPQ
jgi:serine/threonine protein kinase